MESETVDIETAIESLGRLADLFQQRRAQLARGVGLTVQQWRVLEEVSTEHFLPSLFARERDCTPAAISKILRQLLGKRLIRAAISRNPVVSFAWFAACSSAFANIAGYISPT